MTEKKRKSVYNPEADKRWRENNKEHKKYLNYRSKSRSFIKNLAKKEDLEELFGLIKERLKKNNENID